MPLNDKQILEALQTERLRTLVDAVKEQQHLIIDLKAEVAALRAALAAASDTSTKGLVKAYMSLLQHQNPMIVAMAFAAPILTIYAIYTGTPLGDLVSQILTSWSNHGSATADHLPSP